jgi:hypothetical protein
MMNPRNPPIPMLPDSDAAKMADYAALIVNFQEVVHSA